jgi:hypothetical protein
MFTELLTGKALNKCVTIFLPTQAVSPASYYGGPGSISVQVWLYGGSSRLSPDISVSSANSRSTECSILIYHPGLVQ